MFLLCLPLLCLPWLPCPYKRLDLLTGLRFLGVLQVHRIMSSVGGEGTVDEIVEELMVERRWATVGTANLRRRVAALMSGGGVGAGGGPGFESSRAYRSSGHKRVVYRSR